MTGAGPRRPSRRRARTICLVIAVASVAGCGGGSGSTATQGGSRASGADAPALEQRFVQVVDQVAPRVVQVETSQGLGSGIVFDGKGDIVTNAHVVGNATSFRVTTASGKRFSARLVGKFAPNDLAVVRAENAELRPAQFGRSSDLEVGDIVLAIGNPLGLRSSVTNGIVSALGRTVGEPGGATLPNVIQTSAPINPGNSGGALVDLDAKVVGIPTLAATDPELGGSAAPGIGFAIPGDTVRDIAAQIVRHGHVVDSHRAYLGVQLSSASGGAGAVVVAVQAKGPAARAGIQPGDSLLSIDGKPTPTAQGAAAVLARLHPGQRVAVRVRGQDGSDRTVQVELGELPANG